MATQRHRPHILEIVFERVLVPLLQTTHPTASPLKWGRAYPPFHLHLNKSFPFRLLDEEEEEEEELEELEEAGHYNCKRNYWQPNQTVSSPVAA